MPTGKGLPDRSMQITPLGVWFDSFCIRNLSGSHCYPLGANLESHVRGYVEVIIL